jgi:esterase/lipase superfamily enzyme
MPTTTTVHFATNRNPIGPENAITGFGPKLNAKSPIWLRYGSADMRKVKDGFAVDAVRVEPEQIPLGDTTKPVIRGSDTLFEGLKQRLIANKADLLLFIHGFACSFENSLSDAADLKTRWSTKAIPLEIGAFSWPSNGELTPWLDYARDRDDARSSAKAVARSLLRLLDFLQEMDRKEWCGRNIHLVAHSMGNYVLRNALQAMLSDLGARPLPRIFRNIFLMAPDEDDDAFERDDKLARLPELADSVSVYFARDDRALLISHGTKANPNRLGSTGPRTLTSLPHKVVLVDCSDVSSTDDIADARHQYYRKRAEVISDARYVISGLLPERIPGRKWIPERRCFLLKEK